MKRRHHALLALAASSALAALPDSSRAGAQLLYKCIDGGRTIYQQQACPVTSAVEAPASAVKTAPAPTATQRIRPALPAASAALATPR